MYDKKHNVPNPINLLIAAIIVTALWAANWWYGVSHFDQLEAGTFGDMFGAANALFSGFALACLIYAIYIQRLEVQLMRDEHSKTKEILEKQSTSLDQQNADARKQIFENTFFQLLRVFTDIIEGLSNSQGEKTLHGRVVFETYHSEFTYDWDAFSHEGRKRPSDFKKEYETFYAKREGALGHYFRALYTTLKFVHESDVENKKFYTNILRAQLSNAELHFLLYNGLSEHGSAKLKPLLEEYAFFDNLPIDRVRHPIALTKYERGAFGNNYKILQYLDHQTQPPID